MPRQCSARSVEFCENGLPAIVQACLHNLDETLEACKRIGYPIMLKASWGGGGKGIRKVRESCLCFMPASPSFAQRGTHKQPE